MGMTLGQSQEAFAHDFVTLLQQAWDLGFGTRLGEVLRTPEQQKIYVSKGMSKTLDSQHLKKLAADVFLIKNGRLATYEEIKPLGYFWQELDEKNRWGGSWRGLVEAKKSSFIDAFHFERQE